MILVDSSVWVRHFRVANLTLVRSMRERRAVTCDVVLGELALGAGIPREAELPLARLPHVPSASAAETLQFIRRHGAAFRATGVGWADAQIIVTAAQVGARLHSVDGPQRKVWRALGFRLAD